jgi:tRNA (adenine37-N6)-methyltransferase
MKGRIRKYSMKPIGVIRSPYADTAEIPKGPGARHDAEGTLELLRELEEGLSDIEGFSHLYVLWVFDRAEGYDLLATPPTDTRPHGVFATRSPRRPNPIGLTVVRCLRREGPRLHVRGVDMLDGTPILDIKPYLSSVPEAELRRGWLEEPEREGSSAAGATGEGGAASLPSFLQAARYRRVPLSRTGAGHFEAAGTLSGHPVRVLIDTGAAATVVDLARARELDLEMKSLDRCGAGAGGANLEVFEIRAAELRLGDVVPRAGALLAMDLAHVNAALAQKGVGAVDVILGVDVFDAQAAVIDYGSASLFLRDV